MAGTNLYAAQSSTLDICLTDESGLAVLAKCTGVPPTTAGIFAHGAQIIRSDSGTGNKALFENVGSSAVPSWNLIGDITAGEITLAEGNILVGNNGGVAVALDASTSGRILVGDGTTIASVAVGGDATLSSAGVLSVVDSAGAGGLFVKKTALALYDFAIDGGVVGDIVLASTAVLPENAVCTAITYDVLTTCTSAIDAATIALSLPVDGALSTAIDIADGSNPWDAGVHLASVITPIAKKTTAARQIGITVGVEALTAGKILFGVDYYVSQ